MLLLRLLLRRRQRRSQPLKLLLRPSLLRRRWLWQVRLLLRRVPCRLHLLLRARILAPILSRLALLLLLFRLRRLPPRGRAYSKNLWSCE
jgi:hypothetical protein